MNTPILSSLFALVAMLLLASCGSSTPSPLRDYSDAVTNINQVDSRYRPYFRAQNGSNFSLADQRKAYFAALQTAKEPVRSMSFPPRATRSRSRWASRGSKARGGKRVASRGSKARGSKARRGSKAKGSKRVATRNRKATRRRRG